MPSTVSRTELTPGPIVPDSRQGKAFFLSSALENCLCPPLSGRASFEPGDLPALPKLVLSVLAALQGRAEGGAAQCLSRRRASVLAPWVDGCFAVSTHSFVQ